MRKPQHLSPTGIDKFVTDPQEYYLMYLSDNRPERFPQTQPMAAGSAFDAFAKSFLHEKLFGKGFDTKYDFNALFESQVEPHNRDFAIKAGQHCFDIYRVNGGLADLLLELQHAVGPPRFEFEVKGVIAGERESIKLEFGEVPLLGKPDVFFINSMGAHVILDWKVNGYCSKSGVSPMQGYVRLRDNGFNMGCHKNAQLLKYKGIMLNAASFLEDFDNAWARQLSIYAWLCGMDIGSDFIVAVDQIACRPDKKSASGRPGVRIAEHRLKVSVDHQWKIFAEAKHAWEVINSDHFFRDMSKEDSQARCAMLDGMKKALEGDGSENDKWFASMTREQKSPW